MKALHSTLTPCMIAAFCDQRLTDVLKPDEVDALRRYLCLLLERHAFPPYRGSRLDVQEVALCLRIDATSLSAVRSHIQPIFDAVARAVAAAQLQLESKRMRAKKRIELAATTIPFAPKRSKAAAISRSKPCRRGPPPKPVVAFPVPRETAWKEPKTFGEALRLHMPTPERRLEDMKRGELRWNSRDHGWEILIPSVAFKNAHSSFFGSKPFRLVLPDLGRLYEWIDVWVERHRSCLIGPADDPRTFFVKTAKRTSTNAAYDQNTFYEAWRAVIQRYGIYNPWTGKGAIEGLLPHGPHNVRDVLATHILKRTGSYEQANYAIQDTPEMVAQHYGRFLPQDKAEIAARILNKVWEAA